jgi:serine phosphatase RsbU (regulator of sigma subunit)
MWPSGKAAGFAKDYSSLAAPMRVGDQPIGIIALAHRERGRYGHEARAMTATFASYAAVAIENTRLYDAAQEQAYASAALLQVAQAVASPVELGESLASIMRMMPILLGVDSCALYSWNAGRACYVPRAQFGLTDRAKPALWDHEVGEGQFRLLDAARKSAAPAFRVLRPQDTQEHWMRLGATPDIHRALAGPGRLLTAVPLLIKNDLLGVLLVEEGHGAGRLRPRRLEIIQGISQQIAMALQNDMLQGEMVARERLETEAQLARQIQKTFMPEALPQRQGWELAARWETARQVGGDFYDFVELPDGKVGLFIADVADKGMPAALFMALTRTLFRAAVAETTSPAAVLKRVNDLLVPDTSQGMFVTAVYAVLDPKTGELTYANAGHNPPLLIRPQGTVEKLSRTAMALGVADSQTAAERTVKLDHGESLLMHTDGVTEGFSPEGEPFGDERLLEAVRAAPTESAESLLEAVEAVLRRFVGNLPLADDLTMLALRRD